jgi:hypothetical protein
MDKFSELKATVPSNVKSREAVAAGFVTDNNSGGYYVIECQECGAVYPSQQADGGGQIADTGDYNDAICPHCGEESPEECENVGLAWNVQQAQIITLLAELEAKDKRIAELENDLGTKHMRAVEEALVYATDRASELEAKLADLESDLALTEGLCEVGLSQLRDAEQLNKKMRKTVRLPRHGFMTTGNPGYAKNDVIGAMKEAGVSFTVGDE